MPKYINCNKDIIDKYQDGREDFICSDCYNLAMNNGDKKTKIIREILPCSDGFITWDDIAIMITKLKKYNF